MELRPLPLKYPEIPNYEIHDAVFITDNDDVYHCASEETFWFRVIKGLHQYSIFREFFDGVKEINPSWRAVLHVDDILNRKQQIYVKDTLVLYCDSTEGYEKIIPYIHGPYTRLVLHGNINVNQVMRLIHPNVGKVRVSAHLDIQPEEYDDFAEYVVTQTCRSVSCFKFSRNENYTSEFDEKLKEACQCASSNRVHRYDNKKSVWVNNGKGDMYFCFVYLFFYLCIFYMLKKGKETGEQVPIFLFCFMSFVQFSSVYYLKHDIQPMDIIDVTSKNDDSAIFRLKWVPISTALSNTANFVKFVYNEIVS